MHLVVRAGHGEEGHVLGLELLRQRYLRRLWRRTFLMSEVPLYLARKVYIRLPGKGKSNSHGSRPVY